MNRFMWLVVTVSAFAGRVAAQDACPPPSGRLVTVSPGVRVEVVEWSQAGEPLLFLSGMGRTAHAFDHFAPVFAGSDSLPAPQGSRSRGPPASLKEIIDRDRAPGGREPVTELCATSRFAPDGQYIGPVSSDSVGGYTLFGALRLPYSAVTRPVLAIYGTMRDVRDMFPDLATMDSADRARATVLGATVQREIDVARVRLRRALPSAQVVEIPGADHAVFRSHPELVIQVMRAFLARNGGGL